MSSCTVLHVKIDSLSATQRSCVHTGHMIPIDQPRAALHMVKMIMERHDVVVSGASRRTQRAAAVVEQPAVPGSAMAAAGLWRVAALVRAALRC